MVATIFAPEISTLESQVAQLQAQITAAQSRIAALGEADTVASGALQALQEAVAKISGLAPGAIAILKAAALNLFSGDEDQDSDGGNQPITPMPSPNGNGNGHSHKPETVLGVDILEISKVELGEYLENQADVIAPEELNGQFSERCCLLEDAPPSVLTGQSVEIACPIPISTQDKPYIELVQLSQVLAYQRLHNGEIPAAYIGLKNKTRAEAWGRWLVAENNIAVGFEVRAAKRMQGFKHELKLWGISFDSIQRLGKLNFDGVPDGKALNAWFEAASPVKQETTQEQGLEHSDATSAPVMAEVVELQPVPPTIDPFDVPVGVSLKAADDYLLREYIVWATVIARDNGVPKPTQKAIGRLIEGNEIEAYRPRSGLCRTFSQTMDAVIHLISGAGYQMADLVAAQEMQKPNHQETPTASPVEDLTSPATEPSSQVPRVVEVEDIRPGDIVRSLTVRNRKYKVLEINSDGLLECESFGVNPTLRVPMHPGSVELVSLSECQSEYENNEAEQEQSIPQDNASTSATATPEIIEVDDWVEYDGENYQVTSKKQNRLKLLLGDSIKFATLDEVKLVFKKPANFVPF